MSSSSEADSSSDSQNILHSIWNPKAHYRVHKSPPLLPILNQINPLHALTTIYFFKIRFNIIFIYTSRSFKLSISHMFTYQDHVYSSLSTPTCYMYNPSHSSWNYHFLVILSSRTFMLRPSALKLAVVTERSSSCQRYCTACSTHLCPKGSTEGLQTAARHCECCYSASLGYKFITNIFGGDVISICPWRDCDR
jgi:hypothetical protein